MLRLDDIQLNNGYSLGLAHIQAHVSTTLEQYITGPSFSGSRQAISLLHASPIPFSPANYMLGCLIAVHRLGSQCCKSWRAAPTCLYYSTHPSSEPHQICVVGSGPAGCYAVDRVGFIRFLILSLAEGLTDGCASPIICRS